MLSIQQKLSNSFYALLSLPATAMGFALSIQISALSWLLSTKYGLAIDEIGLVWAAGPIAGIFGQVIFGVWSDNTWFWGGRRRPFIVLGGILAALSLLALPNLDIISRDLGIEGILGVAIAVALALDLSVNVGFNPTRSIIADVTPEGVERTKGYTWMQTISGTFGMLAYVIGAVMGKYFLIYFGAGLVLLFTVIPPFFIKEPRDFEETKKDGNGFMEGFMAIKPLWGFLIYAIYRIPVRIMEIEVSHHYMEIICGILTIYFII
ncbi:MAG TPA: MFS transporter, partial [Bacteroidetes bacterium]|nr:MFS transporter [Bacteroidota bacterium]